MVGILVILSSKKSIMVCAHKLGSCANSHSLLLCFIINSSFHPWSANKQISCKVPTLHSGEARRLHDPSSRIANAAGEQPLLRLNPPVSKLI